MPIVVEHNPNPLVFGPAFFWSGYSQARRQAKGEENRVGYQNKVLRNQQNAQIYGSLGNAFGSLATFGIPAITDAFRGSGVVSGPGEAVGPFYGDEHALDGAGSVARGATDRVDQNLIRRAVAANLIGGVGGAALMRDYESGQDRAERRSEREFIEASRDRAYDRKAFDEYGVAPQQFETIGQSFYQAAPPDAQAEIAKFYGYSPEQVSGLSGAAATNFYRGIGRDQVVQRQAAQETAAKVEQVRAISAAKVLDKRNAEVLQGIESGSLTAPPDVTNQISAINSGVSKAVNSGTLRPQDLSKMLGEAHQAKLRVVSTVPQNGIRPVKTPAQQARELMYQVDGYWYAPDRSGVPRKLGPASSSNEQVGDALARFKEEVQSNSFMDDNGILWTRGENGIKPDDSIAIKRADLRAKFYAEAMNEWNANPENAESLPPQEWVQERINHKMHAVFPDTSNPSQGVMGPPSPQAGGPVFPAPIGNRPVRKNPGFDSYRKQVGNELWEWDPPSKGRPGQWNYKRLIADGLDDKAFIEYRKSARAELRESLEREPTADEVNRKFDEIVESKRAFTKKMLDKDGPPVASSEKATSGLGRELTPMEAVMAGIEPESAVTQQRPIRSAPTTRPVRSGTPKNPSEAIPLLQGGKPIPRDSLVRGTLYQTKAGPMTWDGEKFVRE